LDGVIESIDSSGGATHKNLIFEVTTSQDIGRRFRDAIPRIAALNPDGFIYVVNSLRTAEAESRLRQIFLRRAAEAGLPNAHIVFFNGEDEKSRLELERVAQLAWKAATGSAPSRG
jgi:hypothetical protein